MIKDRGSPDALALVPFFLGEAVNIGLLGKLAMKLHLFAKQEDEGPKLKKQKHKSQLDERKLDELLAAQKKEQNAPREPRGSTTRADDGAVLRAMVAQYGKGPQVPVNGKRRRDGSTA